MTSCSDPALSRAKKLETATLSDALDRVGFVGQCAHIVPCSSSFRLSGRAYTLSYRPAAHPAGTVGDYIDDVPTGSVLALDNGGRLDATVWGDILTEIAQRRGLGGTVIDGINRDKALCLQINYPVFSRASWMRTGKDRVQLDAIGAPINIGGARVTPGDLLIGDADGVIVIPKEHEGAVLDAAEEIQAIEDQIRAATRSGMSLIEARKQHRYHQLQTRR